MSVDDAIEVEWADPPPGGFRGRPVPVLVDVLGDLVEHPKRWAIIDRQANATSAVGTWKKRAQHEKNVAHLWEFAGRKANGTGAVYARYLGPADPKAAAK